MNSSPARLGRLLTARRVAVVGASSNPAKLTGRPLAYMLEQGFTGTLFAVNPSRDVVQGLPCYPSLAAIGAPVDLVIVGTAAEQVEAAVKEGIAAGAGGFVIFSSGFAELGAAGAARQQRLSVLARQHSVPIVGPNCLGLIDAQTDLIASFTTAMEDRPLRAGGFAFASQSGALGAYWLDLVLSEGIGVSKWVTTGNECDVDLAAVLACLVEDPATEVIGLYIEDIKDPAAFRRAAQHAAERGKPVLAIKAGRSPAGATAAASHTGALAGEDSLYQALFDQYGIRRVISLTEMIGAARPFLFKSVPTGRRVAILSVSGGAGVMLADGIEEAGLEVTRFGSATTQTLSDVLPGFSTAQNPIDLTATVVQDTALFGRALDVIVGAPEVDLCVLFIGLMASIAEPLTAAIEARRRQSGKPMVLVWMGARPEVIARLRAVQLPVYADIPDCIVALRHASAFVAARERVIRLPPPTPTATMAGARQMTEPRQMTEHRSKAWLACHTDMRVPAGTLIDEACDDIKTALAGLAPPLVAKLQSPAMPHKSDLGGVVLSLPEATAAAAAVLRLRGLAAERGLPCEGILVEQMVRFHFEFLIGLRRDRRFGPVFAIGRGGVEVEVMRDVAIALLPVGPAELERLIRSLRAAPLLDGFRGHPPVDVAGLASMLARLGDSFVADDRIQEIEINPLAVTPHGAVALDALITSTEDA